jgi:hypothetical protein
VSAIDDLISGVPAAEADPLREALGDIAVLAQLAAPAASAPVLDLIHSGVRHRMIRRRVFVAAAAGALALGGASAAAAQNVLPAPAQEAIASFADDHLPVTVPHPERPQPAQTHPASPVRPTDPPIDVPGRLRNDPQGPKEAHPSEAPGQIQKRSKPSPAVTGPGKPVDPGAHGRAHRGDVMERPGVTTDKRLKDRGQSRGNASRH